MFLTKNGEAYRDFILKKIVPLPELSCTLKELEHTPSGARVMHIENSDPENLFCLSFETLPYNSNGVAHILEHTVLCGSRRFPVKDPFFAMTRRSLNTFMNALTGSDFTCYPAASQVEKDFYNLLDVYLDAVFHPQLKKLSFLQEGCRLEFREPKEPTSGLLWKGIVYNEMKGALSSADARLWHHMMRALVPDLPYSHVSGGDPEEIPTLTYEQLIDFHETYYHPSRCLFFFYGNFPLKHHLDFIEEKALKHVLPKPPLPRLPLQPRFKQPKYLEKAYPITEQEQGERKCHLAFGWLTTSIQDQEKLLALSVLDAVLMETDASPLKLPLLQSGLCLSADSYMDTEMAEVPYLIVCKGCRKEEADELEKTIKTTLQEIALKGVPSHLIEAAIHQLEFARTEIGGEHAPFGLTLFFRSALAKQHGCPPENALLVHSLFNSLLEKAKDPTYFPNLIREALLDNSHFVRLILVPDTTLAQKEEERERKKLQEKEALLSPPDIQKLLKQAQELASYQKETEGQKLDSLPKIELSDVPVLSRDFTLHHKRLKQAEIFSHTCFTNHILYADMVFDLTPLTEEELPYAQLLVSLLHELGAGKRNYIENLEYLQMHTGGVGAALSLNIQATDPHHMRPALLLRGKALYRKTSYLFQALKDLILAPRLEDKKRVEELILQIDTSLQNRVGRNALRYATQLALSGFSPAAKINERWHGLSYFKTIQALAKNSGEGKGEEIIHTLQRVKEKIFSFRSPHLILNGDEHILSELEKRGYDGLLELPSSSFPAWEPSYPLDKIEPQAVEISSPVGFTCMAFKTAPLFHPHAPALSLASYLLENKILFPKIREQGGAYGAGATYVPSTGHFTFHSYRDPHLARTLDVFEEAIQHIAEGKFEERDLEEAKLGMIQQLDSPVAPGNRAATAYTWQREGKTKEIRQQYRDHIISLTSQEVKRVVEKELLPQKGKGVLVTFGGKEFLERENKFLEQKNQKPLPIIPL